jgi:hypothetical protein
LVNVSKCSKCGKGLFQMEAITPIGSNRDILAVICHSCNSIAGTVDYASTADELAETNLQIQVLSNKLDTINQNVGQLMNGVKLLYNQVNQVEKL